MVVPNILKKYGGCNILESKEILSLGIILIFGMKYNRYNDLFNGQRIVALTDALYISGLRWYPDTDSNILKEGVLYVNRFKRPAIQ